MILQKQKLLLLFCLLFVVFSYLSLPVRAQARGLVPCGGYTTDSGSTREPPCDVEQIFVLVAKVTNWLIAVAGIYAAYQIINHGFYLAISMGNEEKITQHKEGVANSVIGFILVMFAFMFINTVVNFLLTRSLVSDKAPCRLDLTSPLTYLNIQDTSQCNSVSESILHTNK